VVAIPCMFENAYSFNQNLSSWDVANDENTTRIFGNATTFNQNLCPWGTAAWPTYFLVDIGVVEIRQFISNNRNRIAVSQKASKTTICDAIALAWSKYETDIKIHSKDLNDAGLIKCIDLTSALDKRSPKASSTTRSKLSVSRKKTRNYGSSSSTTSNQQYLRASVDVLFGFVC
jgi:hypothetical protein